jgi:hypothetical protein
MSVYKSINAVQAALAKTGISKANRNQAQGYNFRGIDDVYNALSPLLAEHGLCILPRVLARTVDQHQTSKGGTLFYVTVEAEFDFVCAEDGSTHTVKTFGEAMDSGDKATNKAMSAAYKYAAMQAFAIPTEGDNDADAHTHELAARPSQPPAQDMSPKARAGRITVGVKAGDAAGAAIVLANETEKTRDAIWAFLDGETQDKLTAVWPEVTA